MGDHHTTLRTIDEHDRVEVWECLWRRPTVGQMLTAASIADPDTEDPLDAWVGLMTALVISLRRDGVGVTVRDAPMSVMEELWALHPSFRLDDPGGPGRGRGAAPRGGVGAPPDRDAGPPGPDPLDVGGDRLPPG